MTPRELLSFLQSLPEESLDTPMMVQAGEAYCGPVIKASVVEKDEWRLSEDDSFADDTTTQATSPEEAAVLLSDMHEFDVSVEDIKIHLHKGTVFIEAEECLT